MLVIDDLQVMKSGDPRKVIPPFPSPPPTSTLITSLHSWPDGVSGLRQERIAVG